MSGSGAHGGGSQVGLNQKSYETRLRDIFWVLIEVEGMARPRRAFSNQECVRKRTCSTKSGQNSAKIPPMENKKAQLHWTFQGRFATKSSTKIQKIHQKYQNNKSHGGRRQRRRPCCFWYFLWIFGIFVDDFVANLPWNVQCNCAFLFSIGGTVQFRP